MTRFIAAIALTTFAAGLTARADEQPLRIVFQGGRSIPLESLQVQDNQFVVTTAEGSLQVGQKVPLTAADHVFGDKPAAVNLGIAQVLLEQSEKAVATLEPVLTSQKVTASVPGNFWVESARAAVLAYANLGNNAKVDALLKDLSDATPDKKKDPVAELAHVLMLPSATKLDVKVSSFDALINDKVPTDIAAYATYFKASLLQKFKHDDESLEAYLVAPSLYPTGNSVLNGAAELGASQFLVRKNRREEAISLLNSAIRDAKGTPVADEAKNRLGTIQ